jgi:hypothetical protein
MVVTTTTTTTTITTTDVACPYSWAIRVVPAPLPLGNKNSPASRAEQGQCALQAPSLQHTLHHAHPLHCPYPCLPMPNPQVFPSVSSLLISSLAFPLPLLSLTPGPQNTYHVIQRYRPIGLRGRFTPELLQLRRASRSTFSLLGPDGWAKSKRNYISCLYRGYLVYRVGRVLRASFLVVL